MSNSCITYKTCPPMLMQSCPTPNPAGNLPKDDGICCGSIGINSVLAPVDPTLNTAAAIAYRNANKNKIVKFGTNSYFISAYGKAVKL